MKGTFQQTFKEVGKALDSAVKEVTTVLNTGKTGFYRVIAYLERDLKDPKSTLGSLRCSLDELVREAETVHQGVQKEGGYCETLHRTVKRGADAVDQYAERVSTAVNSYLERMNAALDSSFYTAGRFDETKADAFLHRRAAAAREYGSKFVRKFADAAQTARAKIVEDYRRDIPSPQELTTKYAGIGSAYKGILTRADYEGCLAFHTYAERKIPAGRAYRNQILEDIKTSASESLDELKAFYEGRKEKDDRAEYKCKVAEQLLKKK